MQKGFYDKEALELANPYPHAKKDGYNLRQLDPRLAGNEHMLGQPNAAVSVNKDLMEEILHAQHQREFERGLRPDPPAPLNRPKPVYSHISQYQQPPAPSIEYVPIGLEARPYPTEEAKLHQSNFKDGKSVSSSS